MVAGSPMISMTPDDVDRACERDGKRYELLNGQLTEKIVGCRALFVAGRIGYRLNDHFYPRG